MAGGMSRQAVQPVSDGWLFPVMPYVSCGDSLLFQAWNLLYRLSHHVCSGMNIQQFHCGGGGHFAVLPRSDCSYFARL